MGAMEGTLSTFNQKNEVEGRAHKSLKLLINTKFELMKIKIDGMKGEFKTKMALQIGGDGRHVCHWISSSISRGRSQ